MSRLTYRNAAAPSRAGMTLVEIVVVVAILLVLTSVLSFGVFNIYQSTLPKVASMEIGRMGDQVVVHQLMNGELPSQAEGLALFSDDGNARTDPWNNAYEYDASAPVAAGFDIASQGADGQPGGTGNNADILHSEL